MSAGVVTVTEDETLLDVLQIMQKNSVRRIVVVDDEGELQGLLTADDAIELIAEAMNNLTKLVKQEVSREMKRRP
jgi:CBS domain-containing protein